MKKIICHIGFPKTGTTFLQKSIFTKFDGITYKDDLQIKSIFYDIIEKDETIYDLLSIKEELHSVLDESPNNLLLSYEPLTGHHYKTNFPNRTQIARRLKEIGINKIIITIRNQFDVLESTYKQYVKSGGVLKYSEYFNFTSKKNGYFNIEYFNYFKIIQLYSSLFGTENVLVLQQENLNCENKSFFNCLFDFLEIKPQDFSFELKKNINKSLSKEATNLLRIINHFTYNSFQPSHLISKRISTYLFYRILIQFSSTKSRKTFLNSKYKKNVTNFFYKSNQKIEDVCEIKLDQKYATKAIAD